MKSKVIVLALLVALVLASFAPFALAATPPPAPYFDSAYILVDGNSEFLTQAYNVPMATQIVYYSSSVIPVVSPFIAYHIPSDVGVEYGGSDSFRLNFWAMGIGTSNSPTVGVVYPSADSSSLGQLTVSLSPVDGRIPSDWDSGNWKRLVSVASSTSSSVIFNTEPVSSATGLAWYPLTEWVDYASSGSEVPDLSAIENLLSQIGSKLDTANGYLSTIQTDTTSLRNMVDTLGTYWLSTFVNNPNLSSEGVFYKNFFEVFNGFNVWDIDGSEHPHSNFVDALYYLTYDLSVIGYYSRESQSSLSALQSVWADEEDIAFRESLDDTVTAVKDDYYGDDAAFTADTSKGSKQIVSGIGSAWSAGSEVTPNQTINVMNNTTAWSQFFTPQMAATMDTVNTPVAISVDNDDNPYAWIDDIPPDEMHVPNIPTYEDLYGGDSP